MAVARAPPPPPPRSAAPRPRPPPPKPHCTRATGMMVVPSRSTGSPYTCLALAWSWMMSAMRSTKVLSFMVGSWSFVVPQSTTNDELRTTNPERFDDLALGRKSPLVVLGEDLLVVDADDEDAA